MLSFGLRKSCRAPSWLAGFTLGFLSSWSLHAAKGPADYLDRTPEWFQGKEAVEVAQRILSYQSELGGWPKNMDTSRSFDKTGGSLPPTFDNGATLNELRYLARMVVATGSEAYLTAFKRGLDYVFKSQYPTGGWPQSYPPDGKYHRHITFNDHAMSHVMHFLRDVAEEDFYPFLDASTRREARERFARGIQCIVKCQVVVDGTPTAWCAQHDEITLKPRPARAFEPVSLSGSESVGIVRLLMRVEDPDASVIASVRHAVAWLERVKIEGMKVETAVDFSSPKGKDRKLVRDRSAPPLWARFYEIGTNRPIFGDRDGAIRYDYSEISHERRNHYAWFGNWPASLLQKEYPKWEKSRRR
jgi:PelA/Pel-15E family pectate lyase